MRHLQQVDAEHTAVMVQVENETGTYGAIRDYSPTAQEQFEAQVPAEIIKALHKRPGRWAEVFGKDADEFFHAYSIAHFVEQVAATGKAAYPIPMYAPFGMDYTGYVNFPLGAPRLDEETIGVFAQNYKLVEPRLERRSNGLGFELHGPATGTAGAVGRILSEATNEV
jgi:hypothetical protein